MKFTLIRLLTGSPILALAVCFDGFYFIRCVLGIVGAYTIGRLMKHDLHCFGYLLIGIPLYLITMAPDSMLIPSTYLNLDQNLTQVILRLISAFILYVGFFNPRS